MNNFDQDNFEPTNPDPQEENTCNDLTSNISAIV